MLLRFAIVVAAISFFAALMVRAQNVSVFVPRACIISISLADEAECEGSDLNHLMCRGINLKIYKGCEQIRVGSER